MANTPLAAPRTLLLAERRKAEDRYRRKLKRIFKGIEERLAGLTDPSEITATLIAIANSPKFDRLCTEATRQAVTLLAVGQKATWRAAAAASSKGRSIYKALKAETTNGIVGQTVNNIVLENSSLIKSVPRDIARDLSQLARERYAQGIRPEQIAKEMQAKAAHLTQTEVRRIARTEAGKASTAIIQARAQSLGEEFYVWETSGDGRVRKSHEIMDGVICRWSDPPSPEALAGEKRTYGNYHPHGIFNCRCLALPIVALDDIIFPAKIHVSGSIKTVQNLAQFKAAYGLAA